MRASPSGRSRSTSAGELQGPQNSEYKDAKRVTSSVHKKVKWKKKQQKPPAQTIPTDLSSTLLSC